MNSHIYATNGSKLAGNIPIHIAVSDDMTWLTYSRVVDDSKVFSRNGSVNYNELKLAPLIELPSSFLLYPVLYIAKTFNHEVLEYITQIMQQNKRYTTYRGVTTCWDKRVDQDVWTTSIDTVFFHNVLESSGIMKDRSIKVVTEVGVGGGHLSAVVADSMPWLNELRITDISRYALDAATRNVEQYIGHCLHFNMYLGRGIKYLDDKSDLIIINPPYIPTAPWIEQVDGDPYRGTGLIKEVIEVGVDKLNPNNPNASILMNVSSLAAKDIDKYMELYGDRLSVEQVGESLLVPLKIGGVDKRWTQWLKSEGLLQEKDNPKPEESKHWHRIKVLRIKKR